MSDIQPLTHLKIIGDGQFHRYSTKEQLIVPGEDNAMLVRLNGDNNNQSDVIVIVVHRVCNDRNHSGMRISHLYGNERTYSPYSVHIQ